jgi:hypothetical protein
VKLLNQRHALLFQFMPTPARLWFQFSLRTLFVVVAVIALPLGWSACQLNWIRKRKEFLEEQLRVVRDIGPDFRLTARPWGEAGGAPPGQLGIFGERGQSTIVVLLRESDDRERAARPEDRPYTSVEADRQYKRAKRIFPEAKISVFAWDRSCDDGNFNFVPFSIAD